MDKPSSSVWLSAVMLRLAHVWDDYVYPFGNDFADKKGGCTSTTLYNVFVCFSCGTYRHFINLSNCYILHLFL